MADEQPKEPVKLFPMKDGGKARMMPLSASPKVPPPLPPRGPVTLAEVTMIARDAARSEIAATAKAIAATVQQTMARSMLPLNEKFAMLMSEQYQTAITLNALIELLAEKGIVTKEELEARVTAHHEAEMKRRMAASGQQPSSVLGEAATKVSPDPSPAPEVNIAAEPSTDAPAAEPKMEAAVNVSAKATVMTTDPNDAAGK